MQKTKTVTFPVPADGKVKIGDDTFTAAPGVTEYKMEVPIEEQKKFPVQVMGDRVMVLLIHEIDPGELTTIDDGSAVYKKEGSNILIPDSVKKSLDQLKAQEPQKLVQGLVMSVGEAISAVHPPVPSDNSQTFRAPVLKEGDTIWCYPNTFDAKMMVDGVEYTIYKEKAIVAKDI